MIYCPESFFVFLFRDEPTKNIFEVRTLKNIQNDECYYTDGIKFNEELTLGSFNKNDIARLANLCGSCINLP